MLVRVLSQVAAKCFINQLHNLSTLSLHVCLYALPTCARLVPLSGLLLRPLSKAHPGLLPTEVLTPPGC